MKCGCSVVVVAVAVLVAVGLWWVHSLAGTPHALDNRSIGLLTLVGIVEGRANRQAVTPQLHVLAANRTLVGKKVFVTGGNRGLGRGIATHLAAMGANVIIASRRRDAAVVEAIKTDAAASPLRELAGTTGADPAVALVQLDLSKLASVSACAAELLDGHGVPDIVITNAAVVPSEDQLTEDGFELMFQVNYLGHYALLLSLLSDDVQRPERLVVVASESHRTAAPLFEMPLGHRPTYDATNSMTQYAHTKLALVTLAKELSRRLSPDALQDSMEVHTVEAEDGEATPASDHPADAVATLVTSICPGPVNSDIARHSPEIIKPLVAAMMGALFASPSAAAEAVVLLAGRPDVPTGSHWHMAYPAPARPDSADPALGKRLLEESAALLARVAVTPVAAEAEAAAEVEAVRQRGPGYGDDDVAAGSDSDAHSDGRHDSEVASGDGRAVGATATTGQQAQPADGGVGTAEAAASS